jgi:N-acetylglucosaminyl-diphospho-decaprenol L-rhamnosyltransferase
MDPSPPDLSIVIVNWNVRELLRRCLDSIFGSDGLSMAGLDTRGAMIGDGFDASCSNSGRRMEVIVVDNASADGSVAMLTRDYPGVRVVANRENAGFTRGNNQGLAASRGRFLLFLNPDTEVAPDALRLLLDYAEAQPAVGVVGPQLRYGDGSLQSSRRRFPTLATFFLESTVVQRWWPQNRVLARYYVLDRPDDAISQVDWVVGACMLVRRAVLEQIGGFDEGFFMYSEELDLCRRAVDAGWQVVYLPAAVVTHYEGKSSEQVVAARHIRFHSSRVRYVRKYHGPLAAAAVRSFLLLTFVYQWLEEAAKWLAGFIVPSQRARQPMRRERLAAYGQVLSSGLKPRG